MKQVLARFLLLFLIVLSGAYFVYISLYYEEDLPIYNPSDINPKLVDKSVRGVIKNHTIGDFNLTNQLGQTVTPETFKDKIYVASFMYTTCEGMCPAMTGNMAGVYDMFLKDEEIMFLSHSVTPKIDSVPQLKRFAKKYKIERHDKWHFTTGSKKEIYDLARKHYFAVESKGDGGPEDFIHTENFILIDKEKRIRGFYEGTDYDEIDRLKNDIERLKDEY
jgi:protein SCO1/2